MVVMAIIMSAMPMFAADAAADETQIVVSNWLEVNFEDLDTKGWVSMSLSDEAMEVRAAEEYALRFVIQCGDQREYLNVPKDGAYITVPVPFGSGLYRFMLYYKVEGKKYQACSSVEKDIELTVNPFLFENPETEYGQWYDEVKVLADEASDGAKTQKAKYMRICQYVDDNYCYDYIAAINVRTKDADACREIPNILKTRMGTCQELSMLTVAMCRIEGVPAKFVVGRANGSAHAWVEAEIDGENIRFDPSVDMPDYKQPKYEMMSIY